MSSDRSKIGAKETDALPTGVRVQLDRATLSVAEGLKAGQSFDLCDGEYLVGSDDSANILLDDRGVSKRHARVTVKKGLFVLRDLGSTNGTFVNGTRIREAFLTPGDKITIGTCAAIFEPRAEDCSVPPSTQNHFGPLFGSSLAMRRVFGILERVAPTMATVLIQGESGTGKDVLAQAVHAASHRGPFVVFDCSAVSPELIASELFGHAQGAFTGAHRTRKGAFESADTGTLFLDEVGELPLGMQPKLLRVLESRRVHPVGSERSVSVNVRILAATHRDLRSMVRDGGFREDLYYRLAVVRVDLPPLRQRPEDIAAIVQPLLEQLCKDQPPVTISDEALSRLSRQAWPGNVRELRNVLERSVALAGRNHLEVDHLMLAGTERLPSANTEPESAGSLEAAEKDVIQKTMARAGGSQRGAARILGIHRDTLREKLRRYGLLERRPGRTK